MEYKNGKLQLPNVTLVAMSSVNMMETVKAMKYSMERVDFGQAVLITHKKPLFLPKEITYKHTSKLTDIDCFNYKMAYELGDYIDTDFAMIVHADGFVVHPESWRDEFLEYDYIGSPWPMPKPGTKHSYHDIHGNICRVGNSVSLRSKRLMEFPKKANLKWERDEEGFYNEDIFICCTNKHLFEAEGMKWAPIEVAKYFAHEHPIPEVQGITPFAFHKWWGANAQYPVFKNPWKELWKGIKNVIRPLLFWRYFKK